jgi:hypothetical protein
MVLNPVANYFQLTFCGLDQISVVTEILFFCDLNPHFFPWFHPKFAALFTGPKQWLVPK